jgi:hypothetical protein
MFTLLSRGTSLEINMLNSAPLQDEAFFSRASPWYL